jgi:hypothetical protein
MNLYILAQFQTLRCPPIREFDPAPMMASVGKELRPCRHYRMKSPFRQPRRVTTRCERRYWLFVVLAGSGSAALPRRPALRSEASAPLT